MKRFWETISAFVLTAFAIKLLFDIIKPLAIWLILAAIVAGVAGRSISRWRRY